MLRKAVRVVEQSASTDYSAARAVPNINAKVLDELRRILDSPEFAGSERGRTLLTYLVENALGGGLDRLKERTIGVEIFGRDAAYDTGQDAIVRVSANSIRKRLATYYSRIEAAGEHSGLRIHLPPGAYTPEFQIEPEALVTEPPPPVASARPPRREWWYPALAAVFALGCIVLGVQNWRLRSEPAGPTPLKVLPWSMFGHPTEARIAMTDGNFTMHKFLNRREMALTEYTSARWLWDFRSQVPEVIPLAVTAYTSVASAVTAVRIGSLLEAAGCTPLIGTSRNLQLRDFKEDRPIVLLGSAPSNPWVELFEDRLNFVIDIDIENRIQRCHNKAPRIGEQAFYTLEQKTNLPGVAYAIISTPSNPVGKAPVLIIAGTNAEATEAAGELATDIPRMARELRQLGIDPETKVAQLELLIRVQHLNDTPSRSEVIAHRVTR
ncbi:MAG TPA: hypothetical protein VGK29_21530 [Paludibaculum sp.]|jgi:hypothetical protein